MNGVSGSGPGARDGSGIDHEAYETVRTQLAGVQVRMRDNTGSKLVKAKNHHGRAKGKDSLTAVLDPTVESVTEKLGKALDEMGDHVGKRVPYALSRSSKIHEDTDQDVHDRVKEIDAGAGRGDGDRSRTQDGRRSPTSAGNFRHPDPAGLPPQRQGRRSTPFHPAEEEDVQERPGRHRDR
ncbi:hypothetical protein [Streptomyces sp. NPDC001770]